MKNKPAGHAEEFLSSEEILSQSRDFLRNRLVGLRGAGSAPRSDVMKNPIGKCTSCGSHEYMKSANGLICSYCRVPQGGFTVRPHPAHPESSEMFLTRFDLLYGMGVIRPDVSIKILPDACSPELGTEGVDP